MAATRPIQRRRRLIFALLALLLFLLLVEAGLRVARVTVRSGEAIYTDRWLHHPIGRGRVDWDEYLTLGVRVYPPEPDYYRIPWPVSAKPAGVFRLVCLGDSSTYGLGVADGEAFPELLQKRAAPGDGRRRIEVWNFGRPGYTSYQGRLLLEGMTRELQPDAAVFFFGANDACPAPIRADRDWAATPRWSLFLHRSLYRGSYSYRLLRNLNMGVLSRKVGGLVGATGTAGAVRARVNEKDFWDNREAIRRMLPADGLLLTISAAFHTPNGVEPGPYFVHWRAEADDVDLPSLFAPAIAAGQNPFADEVHPNAHGHELIANALMEKLAAKGIVSE